MNESSCTGAAMAQARQRLRAAGIESAALDARVLAGEVFGLSTEQLIADPAAPVTERQMRLYLDCVARRARGEPVAYITGRREFWSLEFCVAPGCLIPRPDSESIISTLLDSVGGSAGELRILDLGIGSGCLLLALLSEWRTAWGLGIDSDRRAVKTAQKNAVRLGLAGRAAFLSGDWAAAINGRFDVIVANPPYIPSAEMPALSRDVRDFEPSSALDGGRDGLDAVRSLLAQAERVLAPRGVLALEFGPGQAPAVARLGRVAGLRRQQPIFDLAGRERGILLRRQGV